MEEQNVQVEMIEGTGKGGRITKQDILQLLATLPEEGNRKSQIRKLSMLRRKLHQDWFLSKMKRPC